MSVIFIIVFLDVKRIVPIEMFCAAITVDCVDETAGECRLIKQSIIRTKEIVTIANRTMVIDLCCCCCCRELIEQKE